MPDPTRPGPVMRAVALLNSGGRPTLCDLPVPLPDADEVLIRVEASSLNPHDAMVVSGAAVTYMEYRYPVVVGSDVSGTVAEVGASVEDIAVGDRVFGLLRERVAGRGTFAEYVAFPRAWIAPTPSVVSPSDAGVLGLAALTALRCWQQAPLAARQSALVVGATGGVGSYLVQLLKAAGVAVVATARTAVQSDHVRSLGADATVGWEEGDIVEAMRDLHPHGVDAVFDLATRDPERLATLARDVLVDGGTAVSTNLAAQEVPTRWARSANVIAEADQAAVREIAELAAKQILRPTVTETFTLDEVPTALERLAAGVVGKIGIRIDSEHEGTPR